MNTLITDYYWFNLLVVSNGLLLLLLTINVSRLRMTRKIGVGDGGNKQLLAAIRVHSNGTEQVPMFVLIILALMFAGGSEALISSLVITFTGSRLMHAYGMLFRHLRLRQIGAAITYVAQAIALVGLMLNCV